MENPAQQQYLQVSHGWLLLLAAVAAAAAAAAAAAGLRCCEGWLRDICARY
jgi:hypothetical protein